MSKKAPTKLPDKPSQLIRLALKDLEKCERSPKYKIDMGEWHSPNGVCKVCLAGSVIAQSLRYDPHKLAIPNSEFFDRDTASKLSALNEFREGCIKYGFYDMSTHDLPDDVPSSVDVCAYEDDPKQFKRDMRRLASLLAKEGL